MRFMMFITRWMPATHWPYGADVAHWLRATRQTKAGALSRSIARQPLCRRRRDVLSDAQGDLTDGPHAEARRCRRLLDHPDQVQGGGRGVGHARSG